ncbi:MAG TPA: hypothetical protein VF427_11135 [Noviherbaspirillum sp.]
MLSDTFIDWWFAPWSYAVNIPARLQPAADLLARRDQYGFWCAEAGVQTDFPDDFDPGWQVAAVHAQAELRKAAELFCGLIAARAQDQSVLSLLPISERRWCMSIAGTQPLKGCAEVTFLPADPLEVRGLTELASCLEHGFPGIWTRLRLLLPEPLANRVETLLPVQRRSAAGSAVRAQRCWQMCHAHAASLTAS